MLKLMRDNLKNLKWILWFVVFIFVLLIFVDWGSGRGRSRGLMAGVAAKVGSVTISENDFLKELRATEDRYRQLYGKQFDKLKNQLDIPSMTMQSLINHTLLERVAEKMGIVVTDREVLDRIQAIPAFRREDGSFVGAQLYERILRANQSSPEEFEASLRSSLLVEKLMEALQSGIVIPNAELEREYRRRNESASFEVLFVPLDKVLDKVTVSDADAHAYYDAHHDRFTHPEQRQLQYLLVDNSRLDRGLTVPDAQIAEYYKSHTSEFTTPEEVHASHILIRPKTMDDAGWKAAEARAKEVDAKAHAAGADFAALARQYSDDQGSKANGGDLGWFPRGRMVKEFENAVFALKPGQVSGLVKSQFGYHIIKLEARKPAGVRPLDEVRDEIRAKLVEGMADAEGNRRATALREKIDAAKLTTEAQWHTLTSDVVTSNLTPYFAKGETIPGLGRDPELLSEVNAAKVGFIGGPRRSARGWIVYRVAHVRPAGTTPFAEAEAEAKEGAKHAKALELLSKELEGERSSLAAGPLESQASALGGTVQKVTDHKRDTPIAGVGPSPALEEAVFATPQGGLTPVIAIGQRGVAVARVTAKKTMDPAAFAREKDALRTSMVQDELQRLLGSLLAEARREHPVTINTELLDRFKRREA
jgi:peptidyl-prolyl cis-trans isomerase D